MIIIIMSHQSLYTTKIKLLIKNQSNYNLSSYYICYTYNLKLRSICIFVFFIIYSNFMEFTPISIAPPR